MAAWTVKDIPPQTGRTAIITGTGGLGFETALVLAGAGADVILAGRNREKGRASVEKIRTQHPGAKIAFEELDLADLSSVAAFAARFTETRSALDLLVNNAAVMSPPNRQETKDGFEIQFGTNYLGHFALTAHLLPQLRAATAPRVVNLSSLAHRGGALHFDDLNWQRRYKAWGAYGQSKLAMLMFAFELQRRSTAGHWGLMSTAAHPGYARTELIPNGPGTGSALSRLSLLLQPLMSQSPAEGARPTLFAATSPDARLGGYYGPDWFYELKGRPKPAFVAKQAQDEAAAARLWGMSEELTGVRFGLPSLPLRERADSNR